MFRHIAWRAWLSRARHEQHVALQQSILQLHIMTIFCLQITLSAVVELQITTEEPISYPLVRYVKSRRLTYVAMRLRSFDDERHAIQPTTMVVLFRNADVE